MEKIQYKTLQKTRLHKRASNYHFINYRPFFLVIVFLNFFVYILPLKSQTILPTAESAFEQSLPFNQTFIQRQRIKSITFDIIDKKDFQVAEDKGLLHHYVFNSYGNLVRFYYTTIRKTIQKEYHVEAAYHKKRKVRNAYSYTKNEYVYDTISTTYLYNNNQKLKMKRYNDGTFYETYYYDYTSDGKVEKEQRFKETNVSENTSEFKLGVQLPISEEYFKYQLTGKHQYKKTCLNDEGRPYKEVIYTLNDAQQLISIHEQYTVTWISQQSTFTYNSKGQLIHAVYKSNSNGDMEQVRTYEYDTNDCLYTEKHYKNGILQKEISYVTDASKQLNSYIIRDPENKTIRIVKLAYLYVP